MECAGRTIPQLEDVTGKTGITFQHTSDAEKKIVIESMSGGVILFDYDRDGWLDIYFTNAPSVAMSLKGQKAKGALYHNNHDGTFTDVTAKAGIGTPCFAMGGAVSEYDNDGWPDLYVTCYGEGEGFPDHGQRLLGFLFVPRLGFSPVNEHKRGDAWNKMHVKQRIVRTKRSVGF